MALLTLGSLQLPDLLQVDKGGLLRPIVIGAALFLTGAIVGCVRPPRPWRWALAAFLTLALRDMAYAVSTTGADVGGILQAALATSAQAGIYFLYTLPVLGGAIIGGSIMTAGLE